MLLAQFGGFSAVQIAVAVIMILFAVGVVLLYCRWSGVNIPTEMVKLFWMVIGALACIGALLLMARFAGFV